MNKSESIANLAEALSKAQAEMTGAIKDSANPFFKSKYADLASVWDAARGPLTKHGLSVTQLPSATDGYTVVETILMHESGEWIESVLAMKPVKDDPQGIGSCITYARRYALAAIVGISPEDDDGNAASGKTPGAARIAEPIKAPPSPQDRRLGSDVQSAAEKPEGLPTPPKAVAVEREPGSDDEEPEALIELGQQRALHREFRAAIANPQAQSKADVFLRDWLKHEGYVDADGNGTTKTITKALFGEVRTRALAFAASLPKEQI